MAHVSSLSTPSAKEWLWVLRLVRFFSAISLSPSEENGRGKSLGIPHHKHHAQASPPSLATWNPEIDGAWVQGLCDADLQAVQNHLAMCKRICECSEAMEEIY